MKKHHILLAASLVLGSLAAPLSAATELEELSRQLAELQERIRQLEAKTQQVESRTEQVETRTEQVATRQASDPTITLGKSGLQIATADKDFTMRIGALVDADARFYFDGGPGTSDSTFLMRRVRPRIRGTVYKQFSYDIQADFAGSSATLLDANVNWAIQDEFQVRVGKFKSPVGLERLQSGSGIYFIERAYPSSLVPNRDIGIQLHGRLMDRTVQYAIGVFNGTRDGGSSVTSSQDGKNLAGRVFITPWQGESDSFLRGLGFGVGASYGSTGGTPSDYRTLGQQTFFTWHRAAAGDSGTVLDGNIYRVSPQLYYHYGPFGLLGEYALSSQDVRRTVGGTDNRTRLDNTGWQIQGTYVVTGEDATFGGVKPAKPLSLTGPGLGAFAISVRYTELSIDSDAFPIYADPNTSAEKASAWGVALNWYWNDNIRSMIDFNRTTFSGGGSGTVSSQPENALFARFQIAF